MLTRCKNGIDSVHGDEVPEVRNSTNELLSGVSRAKRFSIQLYYLQSKCFGSLIACYLVSA